MPDIATAEPEVKNELIPSQSEVLENLESEVDRARMELEETKREIEEKKKELSVISMREVSKEEMIIVKKDVAVQSKNGALTEKIRKQKDYDDVKVTGKFMNRRNPGQKVKLTYLKYETDPVKWYEFEDGKVYTIPRGFADQRASSAHPRRQALQLSPAAAAFGRSNSGRWRPDARTFQ